MDNKKNLIVYTGPSLSHEEALSINPEIELRNPIKKGDLLELMVVHDSANVLMIDGYFNTELSIWHKEIQLAIENGIYIIGCSSMGALRAVECKSIGMQGYGNVYEAYLSNQLLGDDEVCVAHYNLNNNYFAATSIPLINIRLTLQRSKEKNIFPTAHIDRYIELIKYIDYDQRIWPVIEKNIPSDLKQISKYLKLNLIDYKENDAKRLLKKIKNNGICYSKTTYPENQSVLYPTFSDRESKLSVNNTHNAITADDLQQFNVVTNTGYDEEILNADYRTLALILSNVFQITPELDDIERILTKLIIVYRVADKQQLRKRLSLKKHEIDKFLLEEATILVLRKRLRASQHTSGSVKSYSNYLRSTGKFNKYLTKASSYYDHTNYDENRTKELSYQSYPEIVNNIFQSNFEISDIEVFNKGLYSKHQLITALESFINRYIGTFD